MSSNDVAIRVDNLSKCYHIYEKPADRLKQFVLPRLQKLLGITSKQYYKEFWALRDVSFEVKKGETLGIIGRNGSGKSTLLQLICGTLNPTSGSVNVSGRVAAILELGSGFNPEFTGRENVFLNASVLGLSKEEIDARFDDIVAFADIGDFIEQPVKTYSSGMIVRLAFAVIAHVDADILVIDEALAVGDAVFTQNCMRFIEKFRKNGAIVFVSHDAGAMSRLADRATWLSKGNQVANGITKNVLDQYHKITLEEISNITFDRELIKNSEVSISVDQLNIKEINQLNSKSTSVGSGSVELLGVCLMLDQEGLVPVNVLNGNESLKLSYRVKVLRDISGFLVGFTLKDKLGQKIVEENNSFYNTLEPSKFSAGTELSVALTFTLPYLKAGTYFIDLAIAEGTQAKHQNLLWIYDAIEIESVPSIEVFGLFSSGTPKFYQGEINAH